MSNSLSSPNAGALPQSSGIYLIRCRTTGQVYVGKSQNIRGRVSAHRNQLNNGLHDNDRLQSAWNEFGEDDFTFEVIELVSVGKLTAQESHWMAFYNALDPEVGFNARSAVSTSQGKRRYATYVGSVDLMNAIERFREEQGVTESRAILMLLERSLGVVSESSDRAGKFASLEALTLDHDATLFDVVKRLSAVEVELKELKKF